MTAAKSPKLTVPLAIERLAYRPARAAEAASIGRAKLYELIRQRRLKAKKLDGATLVLADDLRAFLESLPDVEADREPDSITAAK